MAYQNPVVHKTPPKRQEEIKKILESRGVNLTPCSHCQLDEIEIFEVGFKLGVRTEFNKRPERFFSSAIIICNNCGYKSEFDGQSLGLDESRSDAFD